MICQIENIQRLHDTDWTKIGKIFQRLWDRIETGDLENKCHFEPSYNAKIFSMGEFGGILENRSLTNGTPWRTWTGLSLSRLLPWAEPLIQDAKQNNINFINFAYSRHLSYISAHIDGKTAEEKCDEHCNLNFIVRSDDFDAHTWSENQLNEHHSLPGTAWLLETNSPHGVKNSGVRDVFQIKFHSSFHQVKHWLENNPKLLGISSPW